MVVAGMSIVMGRVTVFCRLLEASRMAMQMLRGVMPEGFAAQDHLLLHTSRPDRAQHGGSHRTPGGEQHGQQQQEPDSNGFHEGSDQQVFISPAHPKPCHCDKVKRDTSSCTAAHRLPKVIA